MNGFQIVSEALSPNIVYHYSLKPYNQLKSLEAQGGLTQAEIDKGIASANFRAVRPYYKHISLALDPLPFDLIIGNFDKDHKAYRKGRIVYQHQIDLRKISSDTPWQMVETPMNTLMADHMWVSIDWYKKIYFKLSRAVSKITGAQGDNTKNLHRAVAKYKGSYRERFENLINRKDFEDYKNMYMPTVPHLFVYPTDGILNVDKVKKVKM